MHRSHRLIVGGISATAAAALFLTGCSSNDDPGSDTPESDAGAESTLDAAATAAEELTSAHVVLTVDGQLQSLNATKVDAEIETKPELEGKGTTTLNMGGTTVEAPFVYIDGKLYADVDDSGYQDYGDGRSIYDVSRILDPKTGVPHILRNVQGAQDAGQEEVNGVSTTKITGTVTGETIAGLTSSQTGGPTDDATYDATVWITDDGENEVARVLVEPADNITVTVDIDAWDEEVEVTKPEIVDAPTEKPTGDDQVETSRADK